ncbi:MAG: hypothetical protein GTO18_17245 [Anaerolineales bacterium]|nr:hypothetical protein [Anaerolineales bacterium]
MSITESGGLSKATDAKVQWAHGPGIQWASVEPNPGDRNWGALAGLEQQLINAASKKIIPIVAIVKAPAWADASGKTCGPIEPEDLTAFGDFMYDVVARYNKAPYFVKYWEIWNEPDIDPDLVGPGSWIGCWGDESDTYYGGGYYADMLKIVYPRIKQADPSAKVLFGGLLLDCDPTNPPEGKTCKPSLFLEGALRNAGGDYFDILAFHGYPQYNGTLEDWDKTMFPSWAPRGGVVAGKAHFLREVMTAYGVDKPLFHVEGGLICNGCGDPPGADFFDAQASYVPRLYVRNWADGYIGTIWFALKDTGWGRYEGLLDSSNLPRLSYNAYHFMANLMIGFEYLEEISIGAPLVGYRFVKGTSTIDVYWSPDGPTGTVVLPATGTVTIYDKLGNTIVASGSINVDFHPIYIVRTP